MDRIEIYWGADKDFEEATEKLEDVHFLVAIQYLHLFSYFLL